MPPKRKITKHRIHQNSIDSYYQLNLSKRKLEIIKVLLKLGRATDKQIADDLKYSINRISGVITTLKDDGLVVECGNTIGEFGRRVRITRLKRFRETLF